jgi:hypothetical protein
MSVNRPVTTTRAPRKSRSAGDIINEFLAFIARLAAVAFVGSLVYLAYGVFSGAFSTYPTGYTAISSNQVTHNVLFASQALWVSSIVLSVCALGLLWGWDFAAPLFGLAGGLMYAALPYFAVPLLSSASRNLARQNHPGAVLLDAWRGSGMVFLAAAGVLFSAWAWDRLQITLSAPRRAGGRLKIPFYSACWQTHYCRDEINKLCVPGRKGHHKSCWRHKSGCMCDDSIADRVMADARAKMGKDAEKWLGAVAKAPAPTWVDLFSSTHKPAPFQRIACADCQIYRFHELQKHRLLAPVVMVAIPGLMIYSGEGLHRLYGNAVSAVDSFSLRLAFSPSAAASAQSQVHVALDAPVMEYLVYGIVGLTLITLAARFLEFWCFEARL